MNLDIIRKMIRAVDCKPKVLIIKRSFYKKVKDEINFLLQNNYHIDLFITDSLNEETNAILMDKDKFYMN